MKKLPGFGVCVYQKLGLTSDEVSGYHDLGPPPARGRGKVPGCQKLGLTLRQPPRTLKNPILFSPQPFLFPPAKSEGTKNC